jgi:hypothetical protein
MKPRGRPRLAAHQPVKSSVTTWLRAEDHDRLILQAKSEAKSVSALVRDLLKLRIRPTE